jgi:hypothetical protein
LQRLELIEQLAQRDNSGQTDLWVVVRRGCRQLGCFTHAVSFS